MKPCLFELAAGLVKSTARCTNNQFCLTGCFYKARTGETYGTSGIALFPVGRNFLTGVLNL